jgi:hypothetical protein
MDDSQPPLDLAGSHRRRHHPHAGRLRTDRLPRIRAQRGQGPRAARRVRRPEAGAAAHPVLDVAHGPGLRRHQRHRGRQAGQERARGRRRAGPLPPAQRPGRLRRAGAHGAGLLAALPAGRRPGQLRQPRRRRRRGHALHRGAPGPHHQPAARRDRRRHGRLHSQLRRQHRRAAPAARAAALHAAQWRKRHRGRPGHRDPQPQPARDRRRLRGADQVERQAQRRRTPRHRARPRLPGRRADHQRRERHRRCLPHRPRLAQGARALEDRRPRARPVAARGQRAAARRQHAEGARGDRGNHQPEGQGRQEGALAPTRRN